VLHHHRPIFHRPFQKSAPRSAKIVDSPVPCAETHLVADILCSVVKVRSCLFCVQLFIAVQVSWARVNIEFTNAEEASICFVLRVLWYKNTASGWRI